MKLTDEDRLILLWLNLVPGSTYEQLSQATGRTVDALRHRLPRLEAAGRVRRELVRHGHRSTAFWYPPHHELAMLLAGATREQAAQPKQADPARTAVATAALLRHFNPRIPGAAIYGGRAVADLIESIIFKLALRETSNTPSGESGLEHLPEYLVHHGAHLIAIELRFGSPTEDWTSRLITYHRLGVTHLEVHTDQPLLALTLVRLGDQADTPQVHARVWPRPIATNPPEGHEVEDQPPAPRTRVRASPSK